MTVVGAIMFWGIAAAMVAWMANSMRKHRIYDCPDCEYEAFVSPETMDMVDDRPYCTPCGTQLVFDETWLQRIISKVVGFVEDTRETIRHVRSSDDAEEQYVNGKIDEEELEKKVEKEVEQQTDERERERITEDA